MTETVQVEVSLVLVGEAPPVVTGELLLNQVLNAVEIECLPGDIVQSIEVDISGLLTLADSVHVRDLTVPDTITVLTGGDEMVVRLNAIVEEEEEEEEEDLLGVPSAEDVEVIQRGADEEEEAEE